MSATEGKHPRNRRVAGDKPPLYARVLRLRYIHPGPWWCFLFLEGSLGVAGLLVLSDRVNFWALALVPLTVAIAVKLNDLISAVMPAAHASQPHATQPHATQPAETTPGTSNLDAGGKATAPTRCGSTPANDEA